jgi:glutamate racemase
MIGLFDSGLGGLTVLRRVRQRFPDLDLLFFADQKHMPYGDREPDDLFGILQNNLAWLDARGVEAIVMACNTSCAIADLYGWPPTRAEIFDLLDSATVAVQHAEARRIGVVATAATVKSGAYGRRIRNALPGCEVWEVPAPLLVPLVEAGKEATDEARAAVDDVCAQLPGDLDAVVLGCTHYPVLEPHFRSALGERMNLIDPAFVQAHRLAEFLELDERKGKGATHYVTNGDAERFRLNVAHLMSEPEPVLLEY